jgi:hypothetical protein
MDDEFVRRWRTDLPPFDGVALSLPDLLPLSRLQPIVQTTVESLHRRFADEGLYTLHDWHEHDGWASPTKPSRWEALTWIVSSRHTLRDACTGETFVLTGFFPESREFYLRIYIPDEYEQPATGTEWMGDFDVTCAESQADLIGAIAQSLSGVTLLREPASRFFGRSWAG